MAIRRGYVSREGGGLLSGPALEIRRVTPQLPSVMHRLEVPKALLGDRHPLNPSIVVVDGVLRVVVRTAGGRGHYHTTNLLGRIDERWALCDVRPAHDRVGRGSTNDYYGGYEDCRLFVWQGHLRATASVFGGGRVEMVLLTFDAEGDIVGAHTLPSGASSEKNWMPLVRGDDLSWVYSTRPLVVLPFTACEPSRHPKAGLDLRGGSQLVPYKDGFVAVVHEQHRGAGVYLHRIVRFSADMTRVQVGRRFHLRGFGIEFVAGIARWADKWVMSFGVADHEAWLAVIDDAVFDSFAEAEV